MKADDTCCKAKGIELWRRWHFKEWESELGSRESEFELRSETVGKREIKGKSICREGFPHGLDVLQRGSEWSDHGGQ